MTPDGQYSGTRVVGDDGSSALSLAAVSGGTMSSPSLETPAPEPTNEPMVSIVTGKPYSDENWVWLRSSNAPVVSMIMDRGRYSAPH
jgi:hypothetical protein